MFYSGEERQLLPLRMSFCQAELFRGQEFQQRVLDDVTIFPRTRRACDETSVKADGHPFSRGWTEEQAATERRVARVCQKFGHRHFCEAASLDPIAPWGTGTWVDALPGGGHGPSLTEIGACVLRHLTLAPPCGGRMTEFGRNCGGRSRAESVTAFELYSHSNLVHSHGVGAPGPSPARQRGAHKRLPI